MPNPNHVETLRSLRHLRIGASFVMLVGIGSQSRDHIFFRMACHRLILSSSLRSHHNTAMDYGVFDHGAMNWLAILCGDRPVGFWARFGIPLYLVRRGDAQLNGTTSNWANPAPKRH